LPYSVASLKIDNNWSASTAETPDSYLQGKVSGLNVIRRSGTPSIGANMFLRGINSFYTTNQPLIIVDGLIFNNDDRSTLFSGFTTNALENLDIKDVEEVSVLKDAAAAVYGTKGANGVILITTKRARSETTKIDFAAYGGINSSVNKVPVMESADYRSYLAGILQTRGLPAQVISSLPFMNDNRIGNTGYYQSRELNGQLRNYDWQDEVFKSGYNQNYHLNVSGGDNIARYNLSVGYLNNSGAISKTNLTRYFTRFNSEFNLTRKLQASTFLSFSSSDHKLANQGQAYRTSPIYLGLVKSPFNHPNEIGENGETAPVFADADVFNISNPSALIAEMDAINTNYRVTTSALLKYQFTKRLSVSNQLGIIYDKVRDRLFIPSRGVPTDTLNTALVSSTLGSNTNRLFALFNDARVNYSTSFGTQHMLSANIGSRIKQDNYERDYGLTYNSSTDDYRSLGSGNATLRDIGGGKSSMRWLNTYANVDYSFLNRYYLTVTTAVDASSRFGKTISNVPAINGNKLAVMPSVAASWLISSESFLANSKVVDLLKLRGSYGLVGNDDIGDYNAKAYYTTSSLYNIKGLTRGNVGNTNLRWETVEKLNLGLDVSILSERLNLSLDLYQNDAKDLITFDRVSPVTGFDFSISNSGGIRTRGLDLSLSSRIINKQSLKWDMSMTFSKFNNEVTSLQGGSMETNFSGASILTKVGSRANLFYGYRSNGVYASSAEASGSGLTNRLPDESLVTPQGGDIRFLDMSGDGKFIDADDRVVIGDPTPDFTGMLGNSLNYKRWGLDAIFTFSYGNDVYNSLRHRLESMSGYENQLLSANNRWRAEGQVTNVPRAAFGDPVQNARFSDRWIEDGSYVRLRTLSLSYNFRLSEKNQYFKTLQLYGNANNVFTISKYLGYDPEFSATRSIFSQGIDTGMEPQFRTMQLGVRVGL
jgi:TonB-linked SusC/RagA family outer membrane protein